MRLLAEQHKIAQEAAQLAMSAADRERKRREEAAQLEHQRLFKERRDEFLAKYKNVWATGDTGVSWMTMTVLTR